MKKKGIRYGWYIIAGTMFYLLQQVPQEATSTLLIEIIFMVIACYTYYWTKKKIKFIKNDFLKSIIIGAAAIIIFSFLAALSMGLVEAIILYK